MTTDPTPDPAPVCGQSTPSADKLRTRPAFDYGEPWKAVTYRDGGAITRHGQPIMEAFGLVKRAITCVNACAKMADPAAEIAELRRERDEARQAFAIATSQLVQAQSQLRELRDVLIGTARDLALVRCLEPSDTMIKRAVIHNLNQAAGA